MLLEPAAARAQDLARRKFLAPERIDMSALAQELGVNRVTLYRWVGSRDKLLVEVVWALTEETLELATSQTNAQGAERIVETVTRFLRLVIDNAGMQRWLSEEGEHAMRLLTRHDAGFQPRLIQAIEDLLKEEADRLALSVDLHELAYVIVRLIESYTYLDLITGEAPDAEPSRADPEDAAARRPLSGPRTRTAPSPRGRRLGCRHSDGRGRGPGGASRHAATSLPASGCSSISGTGIRIGPGHSLTSLGGDQGSPSAQRVQEPRRKHRILGGERACSTPLAFPMPAIVRPEGRVMDTPLKARQQLPHAVRFSPKEIRQAVREVEGFNAKLALIITRSVGTMACAYVFAVIALISLPAAINSGQVIVIVAWIAQTFLQLVLLSIIMVGQSVQSAASDARAAKEFVDIETIMDRLDANTAGGIKDVLDAIHAISPEHRSSSGPSGPAGDPSQA